MAAIRESRATKNLVHWSHSGNACELCVHPIVRNLLRWDEVGRTGAGWCYESVSRPLADRQYLIYMKFALFVPFNIEPLRNYSGIFLRSPFIYLRWLGFHYRRNCGGIYSFQIAIVSFFNKFYSIPSDSGDGKTTPRNSLRLQGIPNLLRVKIIKSLLISLDMGITIEDHNLEIISSHYISWSINTKSEIQVSMGAGR